MISIEDNKNQRNNTSCKNDIFMLDVSPTWDKKTISRLLNKNLCEVNKMKKGGNFAPPEIGSVIVDFFCIQEKSDERNKNQSRTAKLTFASEVEKNETVQSYEGLVVPLTHGYHYYHFSSSPSIEFKKSEDETMNGGMISVFSPPLHLQLIVLTTDELQRRVDKYFPLDGIELKNNREVVGQIHHHQKCPKKSIKKKKKRPTLSLHLELAFRLCRYFPNQKREIETCSGIPVPKALTDYLLKLLRSIPSANEVTNEDNTINSGSQLYSWPPLDKKRKGVISRNYLTLRKNRLAPCWSEIWDASHQIMNCVYGSERLPAYNALAITKNFQGSPHIDQHDKTFQHVIALGDFKGGYLCTELDDEKELQINVHQRLGRIDGRSVHWVSQWRGTERYSVVYYTTDEKDFTPPLQAKYHMDFLLKASQQFIVR